jgi:hypothetical protein
MKVGWLKEQRRKTIRSCLLSMLPQVVLALLYPILFVLVLIRSGQIKFTIRRDIHVQQSFRTRMINNTYLMCVDEGRERTTLITVT